ncbi:hypothetical protein SAMN04488693_101336 [Arthrobacter subterraneus]|uniref:Uncharacterized protein n=1 Tax=Arthrobacter subterraneus TaxID=335973 RepID=A0A1G8CP34_9MICC|nr:hypothetical protein SAMN04488693_101336 [Arthrobacter subterraneus]
MTRRTVPLRTVPLRAARKAGQGVAGGGSGGSAPGAPAASTAAIYENPEWLPETGGRTGRYRVSGPCGRFGPGLVLFGLSRGMKAGTRRA